MIVREIWRYPVKSMGGERLESAPVGELGLTGDRGWGVRDAATGMILTGRREPRLLMAQARLADGHALPVVTVDGDREIATSAELSAWLDRPVDLVPAGDAPGTFENPLDVDHEDDWISWQGPVGSFHDGASTVSLVSTGSLGDHERRRFRINLILDGDREDDLVGRDVAVGGVELRVRQPIERCIMVARAQPGIPADLGVLKQVIRDRGNVMGVGATVLTSGSIAVGDVLR